MQEAIALMERMAAAMEKNNELHAANMERLAVVDKLADEADERQIQFQSDLLEGQKAVVAVMTDYSERLEVLEVLMRETPAEA